MKNLYQKISSLLPQGSGEIKYIWKGRSYTLGYNPSYFFLREDDFSLTDKTGLRFLQSFVTFLTKRQGSAGSVDFPVTPEEPQDPHGSDEVVESQTQTSEDVHGGNEVSCSVQGSSNPCQSGEGNSSLESMMSQDIRNQGAEPKPERQVDSRQPSTSGSGERKSADFQPDGGASGSTPAQSLGLDSDAQAEYASGSEPASPCGDRVGQESLSEGNHPSDEDGEDASGCPKGFKNLGGQSTEGLFSLLEVLKERNKNKGGGGGSQLDTKQVPGVAPSKRIQEAIELLASGEDWSQKIDGFYYWHGKKLARAITFEPHKLSVAKYDRPGDKVYFFVDTSGSVRHFGEFIIKMILSTKKSDRIEVWSGSEAHPERDENMDVKKIEYIHSFYENMKEWLEQVKPEQGSTLIFWGDLHDVHIEGDEKKIKQLLSQYRCIWLHCCDDSCDYDGCELDGALMAGFTVLRNINTESRLVTALKTIRR